MSYVSRGGRGGGSSRGRGGGGNRPPRTYNNGNYFNSEPRRDLEGELLSTILAEFQVYCAEVRPFDEIFRSVQAKDDLFTFIYKSADKLREFIACYKEYFYFDPNNPALLRWTKERPISKRDPKEPRRRERRIYAKTFDKTAVQYDLILEGEVLNFMTSLFIATGESYLNTELLEKAVKQAFLCEVDLLDYCAIGVRNFMILRDHVFQEHLDCISFYGKHAYEVVQKINDFIRLSVQGDYRETLRRVHDYYLNSPEIGDEARKKLNLSDRKAFENFILRGSFVFDYEPGVTHVKSKMPVPLLHFDPKLLVGALHDTVETFKDLYMTKHPVSNNTGDEVACAIDANGCVRELGPAVHDPSDDDILEMQDNISTSFSGSVVSRSRSGVGPSGGHGINENPFQRRELAAATSAAGLQRNMASMAISGAGLPSQANARQAANSAFNQNPDIFLRAPGS